ncbi:MAG: bifunctional [glutamate--ammonia ligase]-adenylyl-L-tyrosine phosphorylase/[glutamate--ammonia-ligase] adenylyltransferase [Puniceicoccaceae bacterium]|nr:MAG: bifunctional [glutamate--ammonia ligase]-adenylyl-L-tyrosine phosphorylase/[glutamate--ammonia-ligase] adenylyltransferase [Puniceicoccaceae bacterium]
MKSAHDEAEQFLGRHPGVAGALGPETVGRLARFVAACPLYWRMVEQDPAIVRWIEDAKRLEHGFGFQRLMAEWKEFREAAGSPERAPGPYLEALRQFRRRICMGIAYRSLNDHANEAHCVAELTALAEFCLRECLFIAEALWENRHGTPWDEDLDQRARFCVLGLGKLGGEELNFSSDIDLIYLYEGDGHCRLDGRPGSVHNGQFFAKVAETITGYLKESTANGFLYRPDLRLRPGGAQGPLVPSFSAVENYYAASGQTWERMALLKARPVAGDLTLGAELMENLHAFRYPRHPPPSVIHEIASMKSRTEREVVGSDNLSRDIKSGPGGIREIEFFVQTLQILHAGRYPFLQTHSTAAALGQLSRYGLIEEEEAKFNTEAYWFLRRLENLIQMREEHQLHTLPAEADARATLAGLLGFPSLEAFADHLDAIRRRIRERYRSLFTEEEPAGPFEEWWDFFTTGRSGQLVKEKLAEWFPGEPEAHAQLELLVRGSRQSPLQRSQVHRFLDLSAAFPEVLPRLAAPLATLGRVSDFATRYGARIQFLNACVLNPDLFQVLCLLFDRSRFIHEALGRHPEILEEVLRPEIIRQRKTPAQILRELRAFPADDFTRWLSLYALAEQIRTAIGHLLGFLDTPDLETDLSDLADAVLALLMERHDPDGTLSLVALGKFGGRELTFGSDLDVVFLAAAENTQAAEKSVRAIIKALTPPPPDTRIFEIDLRLRPHGASGPLVPTLAAYEKYHQTSAQPWEHQLLTRARFIQGSRDVREEWESFRERLLFSAPPASDFVAELWKMRLRVQKERDVVDPPEHAFKTGRGGLVDFEFLVQIMQLLHGADQPRLRSPSTRTGLRRLTEAGLLPGSCLDDYSFLKAVEIHLRRDAHAAVSVLPPSERERLHLARWMGFSGLDPFRKAYRETLERTRQLVTATIPEANDD